MGECTKKVTTHQALKTALEAIATRKIGVAGIDTTKGPEALDNLELNLDGPPDGSVIVGTTFQCSRNISATVERIGTKVYDGHVLYKIRLHYQ